MRRWEIKKGNFIGWHYIYDTENEAAITLGFKEWYAGKRKFKANELGEITYASTAIYDVPDTFRHWTDRTVREKDWVRTDDGRIVQILKWQIMPGKKYKGEIPTEPIPMCTVYVRFPFASGNVYYKIDGTITYKYIHADFFVRGSWNNPNRTSLSSNKSFEEGLKNPRMSTEKRLYAYYLAITGNPVKAYQLTFPGHYNNKLLYKDVTRRALKLFKDKQVLKELSTYMTLEEFREKLEKELDDTGLDHKFLFGEIKRGAEGAEPGSDDHREMIKMAMSVVERVKNQPLLTSKEETGFVEKKNGELPATNVAPVIPIPNGKIIDKVKQNTPELYDLIETQNPK